MRSSRKTAVFFWLILDVGIAAFVAAEYWPARQESPDEVHIPQYAGDLTQEGDLQVGDLAPDFTLKTLDGKSSVRLSSFRDKRPVVLVFGSYTCPTFRNQLGALYSMRDKYKGEAEFLFVYIQEAHPIDGRQLPENRYWGIEVLQPKTIEERVQVAAACAEKLHLESPNPFIVDTIDNKTQADYAAWPIRLYVVAEDGRVAYKGRPGPIRFSIGETVEALNKQLQADAGAPADDRHATGLTERHALLSGKSVPAGREPSAATSRRSGA